MMVKEAIAVFRMHQKSQSRQKTRDSYGYPIRNLEALFGASELATLSTEDIHQFILIVTDGRARSSARLRYAQIKCFFNFMVENHRIKSNPCDDPTLRKAFRAPRGKDRDVVPRETIYVFHPPIVPFRAEVQ
jgi:site-specific recombinase XerD